MNISVQWVSAKGYQLIAPEEFARFGLNEVAYVRFMRTDDLKRIYGARFPNAMEIADETVYALMDAEGDPIVVGTSAESVEKSAQEQELELVMPH